MKPYVADVPVTKAQTYVIPAQMGGYVTHGVLQPRAVKNFAPN
jgi:hypothetical protein